MNCRTLAALGIVVLCSACFAQQPPAPGFALQPAEERLLTDLERMPHYTCVQTITRTYYDARAGAHGSSCSAFIAAQARKRNPKPFAWDRLRLEVAWIEDKNLYSWIGEPAFGDDNLEMLAGEGPLSSGDFGVILREILLRAPLSFQRELVLDGNRALEYSYEIPLEKSTYKVKTTDGWARVGYSGTLLFDLQTSGLVKLTMRIATLPSRSSACQVANEVAYGRIPIHERLALIPRETRLDVINTSGTESSSEAKFSNCREYKSTVRFLPGAPKNLTGPQRVAPAAPGPAPLPAGLAFNARIITPIDSDTAAAGDPIEAVLRSTLYGRHKELIAPAGARIHGRLTGVHWRAKPELNQQISMRFETIEVNGRNVPLSAILEPPHVKVLTGTFTSTLQTIPPKPANPYLGGIFSFRQEHLRLKTLDARWITVAPGASIKVK
jgi:hypothetical protein